MDGKIALISGAVFAGVVGAAIVVSEIRGSSPADTVSSVANSVGIGSDNSSGKLIPLTDLQNTASASTDSGRESKEHGSSDKSSKSSKSSSKSDKSDKSDKHDKHDDDDD